MHALFHKNERLCNMCCLTITYVGFHSEKVQIILRDGSELLHILEHELFLI